MRATKAIRLVCVLGLAGCSKSSPSVTGEWFGTVDQTEMYLQLAQQGASVTGRVCEKRPDHDCLDIEGGSFKAPALAFTLTFEKCASGAACVNETYTVAASLSEDGKRLGGTVTPAEGDPVEASFLRCSQPGCADQIGGGGSDGGGGDGGAKVPLSLNAQAVGAWSTVGSSCPSGCDWNSAFFLCPGGRIRGAGTLGNTTELACGSYTVSPRGYQGCGDKMGCFDRVTATVTSTLILGGQKDVQSNFKLDLYLADSKNMIRLAKCKDGSDGYLKLKNIAPDTTADYCVSSACPAPSGSSSGSYGSCGTDCDCGECWYCESKTCRYGGKGPYGCYRGCQP